MTAVQQRTTPSAVAEPLPRFAEPPPTSPVPAEPLDRATATPPASPDVAAPDAPVDPADPAADPADGAIRYFGYPRRHGRRGVRRLYESTDPNAAYAEIEVTDIVEPPSTRAGASESARPLGPGQVGIWVRADAQVAIVGVGVSAPNIRKSWPRG